MDKEARNYVNELLCNPENWTMLENQRDTVAKEYGAENLFEGFRVLNHIELGVLLRLYHRALVRYIGELSRIWQSGGYFPLTAWSTYRFDRKIWAVEALDDAVQSFGVAPGDKSLAILRRLHSAEARGRWCPAVLTADEARAHNGASYAAP